jgi:catechol 2,3-dioxygenase-like lactoylglutathione lyase family enzyme
MLLRRGEINLYVSNLDRAADFYVDALGFEVVESPAEGGYRKLQNGDIVLTLFLARRPGPAEAAGNGPGMTADLQVDDDEIEEVRRRLKAAGAKVSPLQAWAQGRHLLFSDLDGIGWELLSS